MEDDRAATNLGPETPEEIEAAAQIHNRQPRRRFIGRRAADEKAAAEAAKNGGPTNTGTSLTTSKPARATRALNAVPADILEDPSINEAIALLPTNYNFEIHKTIHRIRTLGAKNVALQFPEGLLMFAPLISDILTRFCPGSETLIMGDVTYGACCIDDYTARALGCDLLVHYGHSCLVPIDQTGGIKTLYVFVTIGIDVDHLLKTIERNVQPGKRIALVGTIQFNSTIHAIVPRLRSMGYDPVLPRSAPLSAGEILGCTAPTLTATSSNRNSAPTKPGTVSDADMILYVGDGRFHLESILISSPALRSHTYRYDPYSRRLTHETYEHHDMHTLRRAAIRTARLTLRQPPPQPNTWAIILGTLGRQGNSNTLDMLTAHLDKLAIPWITLLLSEIMPAKLALLSTDIAVFVQIACPRLSIDWGYAFERPLLSPYEALVAVGVRDGKAWEGGNFEEDGVERKGGSFEKGDTARHSGDIEGEEVGVYPMDFYEKSGLGRTKREDVDRVEAEFARLEIEVT